MIPEITLKKDKTLIQCGASSHTVYSLYLHILAISEELFDIQTAKHSNPVHCVFLVIFQKSINADFLLVDYSVTVLK